MTVPTGTPRRRQPEALLQRRCSVRRRASIFFGVVVTFWILLLLQQHATVQLHQQQRHPGPSSLWTTTTAATTSHHRRPADEAAQRSDPSSDTTFHRNMPATSEAEHMSKSSSSSTASATFNGIPVAYHHGPPPVSQVDCRGTETIHQTSDDRLWLFRSCRFENLCFDLQQHDFVVHQSSDDGPMSWTNRTFTVGLGGINPRWDEGEPGPTKGSWKMEWFPRVETAIAVAGYYQLPPDYVWVPFHSMAGHNVGHLMWDDFYAIFRLASLWDLIPSTHAHDVSNNHHRHRLLLLRHKLPMDPLYATCDIRRNKRMQCKHNFEQFLSVMGVDPNTFSTNRDFRWNASTTDTTTPRSLLICAQTAVAGLGLLTDHGLSDHGWEAPAAALTGQAYHPRVPHNLGHGRDLFSFREFILDNVLGHREVQALQQQRQQQTRRRILFSLESSKDWDRRLNFTQHRAALMQANWLDNDGQEQHSIEVQAHRLWQLSLEEQLRLAVTTDILVTVCGGGSMTATFLPRGATLIVFYNPVGGYDFAQEARNYRPARLDWDLLNHAASHLRVHWMPIRTTDNGSTVSHDEKEDDLELFVELIRHELEVLESL